METKKLNIENVRGVNGTFFKRPKIIEPIGKFINKKCQTITYLDLIIIGSKNF